MIYRKYEFQDEAEAKETLPNCIQVHIVPIVIKDAEVDEDGEVITAPIFSDRHAVDCLLTSKQALQLTAFEVWPKNPQRFIAGWEKQYKIDYDNLTH